MENNENLNEMIQDVMIVSKANGVKNTDFNNVIQILDETGNEVVCTYDKFVEIFDKEGLPGFIM